MDSLELVEVPNQPPRVSTDPMRMYSRMLALWTKQLANSLLGNSSAKLPITPTELDVLNWRLFGAIQKIFMGAKLQDIAHKWQVFAQNFNRNSSVVFKKPYAYKLPEDLVALHALLVGRKDLLENDGDKEHVFARCIWQRLAGNEAQFSTFDSVENALRKRSKLVMGWVLSEAAENPISCVDEEVGETKSSEEAQEFQGHFPVSWTSISRASTAQKRASFLAALHQEFIICKGITSTLFKIISDTEFSKKQIIGALRLYTHQFPNCSFAPACGDLMRIVKMDMREGFVRKDLITHMQAIARKEG